MSTVPAVEDTITARITFVADMTEDAALCGRGEKTRGMGVSESRINAHAVCLLYNVPP